MINDKLKKLIMPYLKMELSKREQKYIDDMFNEAVIGVDVNGLDVITLPLLPQARSSKTAPLSLQFLTVNGAYCGLELWEVAKQNGRKV